MVASHIDAAKPLHPAAIAIASAIATIPVWLPTFPAMVDLPQHAAQVSLLAQLRDEHFQFGALFEINWFTPYLLGYLLIYVLVPLLGVTVATKTILATALAALPITTAQLMRTTGADPRWAILTIPVLYGFTYQWGFLNFIVAAPIGIVFLTIALRHARSPTMRTSWIVAALVVALFFCHAMICIFFGFIAGTIILAHASGVRACAARLVPLLTVVPIGLAWGLQTLQNPIAQKPIAWDLGWFTTTQPYYRAIDHGWGWGRTAGLLPRLLGVDPGVLPVLVGTLIFALPLLAGARPSRDWRAWLPCATCGAVLLLAPETLFGTNFTSQRFTVFLLPCFLATLSRGHYRLSRRLATGLCLTVAAGWITYVSWQTLEYDAESRDFEQVLDHMAPGERAMSLVFSRTSSTGIAPVFLHFPSWYSALAGGVVDPSFAWTHVQLVVYRPEHRPPAGVFGFEWNPQAFHWGRYDGDHYRYFVVRAPDDMGPWLFRLAPRPVRLSHHVGTWWLYEQDEPVRSSSLR